MGEVCAAGILEGGRGEAARSGKGRGESERWFAAPALLLYEVGRGILDIQCGCLARLAGFAAALSLSVEAGQLRWVSLAARASGYPRALFALVWRLKHPEPSLFSVRDSQPSSNPAYRHSFSSIDITLTITAHYRYMW